jgi:hypothetical protein
VTQLIDQMFAFVAVDPKDDTEGLVGFTSNGMWVPMVGADPAMVEKLRPIAREIGRASGKTVRLLRFSQRTEEPV